MNKKTLFNDRWEFAKSSLAVTDCAGLTFEPVDLPHDWLIYNTRDLYENSIGWYRKTFRSTQDGRHYLLCFDGVYMDSSVYVNGHFIGEWKNGYSSFEHDITDALVHGLNEIIVKVVHQSPNSRWYSGAGIYRNVWLKERETNYIETDGVYITTKQTDKGWLVEIDTEMNMDDDVQLSHTIMQGDHIIASVADSVNARSETTIIHQQRLVVNDPQLWSPQWRNGGLAIFRMKTGVLTHDKLK